MKYTHWIMTLALLGSSFATSLCAEVLVDNGPIVTGTGTGAGGADVSELQTGLGLTTLGYKIDSLRMADDFTVSATQWNLTTLTLLAYQSPPGTTYSSATVRIWKGPPGLVGSSIIWGDDTTNRLLYSADAQIYRVATGAITGTDRPIQRITLDLSGLQLGSGTYWLDVSVTGLSTTYLPPITRLGETTTGNARIFTGGWTDARDAGTDTTQGLPFILEGAGVATAAEPIPTLSWSGLGLLVLAMGWLGTRRRESL